MFKNVSKFKKIFIICSLIIFLAVGIMATRSLSQPKTENVIPADEAGEVTVPEERQSYTPRTLVDARWGVAEDEFGLQSGDEIETVGPLTFTVGNNGTIYIFDTIKKQVKKFSAEGVCLGNVLSDVSGTAICVDSNENLYLLRNHTIEHYSIDGDLIKIYQISENINLIEGYGQTLFFDKAGNLLVNRLQTIYRIGSLTQGRRAINQAKQRDSSLELLSPNQQPWTARRGKLGSSIDNYYATNWIDNHTATIQVLSSSGTILTELFMQTSDIFGAILFLKQDNQSAIYIETERITVDNYVHLEIRKYNPYNGDLLAIVELPNDYSTTIYKKIHVNDQGKIYQLLTTPMGVRVIEWQEK